MFILERSFYSLLFLKYLLCTKSQQDLDCEVLSISGRQEVGIRGNAWDSDGGEQSSPTRKSNRNHAARSVGLPAALESAIGFCSQHRLGTTGPKRAILPPSGFTGTVKLSLSFPFSSFPTLLCLLLTFFLRFA